MDDPRRIMETMTKSLKSVYIDAPVERVFPFVRDVSNWGALTPWWVAVTYEPVDIAPDGTGTLSYSGKALRVIDDSGTGEIMEVIDNGRVVYRDADPFQGIYTFLFESVGPGTTVTILNERESLRAERIPVVGRFVTWILGQHDDQVLRKLKTFMERTT
jgi:uncharacterized protein YndB with AHSA1/START domain